VKRVGRVAAAVALLLAVSVGVLAGGGGRAGAQEYGAVCSVAAAYDEGTGVLRVVGTGLQPGFTTPIVLDGETIGEATADADGNFEVEITIELDVTEPIEGEVSPSATYVVSILCNGDGDQSSTTVTTSTLGRVVHVLEPATIDCFGNLRGFAQVSRPGTEVSFTLDHTGEVLAVVESDAAGRASYAVIVQLDPGTYTVTARGQDAFGDPFALTSAFVVPQTCVPLPSDGGGGPLPRTGSDSVPLALTGVVAVGLGSLTLLLARRRGTDAA
jgi:LPXTG-motif cell wall-anchored protein